MSVRDRVLQGKSVRVRPLAEEIGVDPSTVYSWVSGKLLKAVTFAGVVMIPADAAKPLLGICDSVPSPPAGPARTA